MKRSPETFWTSVESIRVTGPESEKLTRLHARLDDDMAEALGLAPYTGHIMPLRSNEEPKPVRREPQFDIVSTEDYQRRVRELRAELHSLRSDEGGDAA